METDHPRRAIIIGAGPAGLTAALELIERSDIRPIVLERSGDLGGLSRTEQYKGNRMDIGGHRFFSKSDRVMNWWLRILPLEPGYDLATLTFQNQSRDLSSVSRLTTDEPDRVMLVRPRKSRIYFLRQFFDYPLKLNRPTLGKLGWFRTTKILLSYLRAALYPIRRERTLEDYFINRFGRELYQTFFKSYTEKVWGTPCHSISAEWGRQRIQGLSLLKLIRNFLGKFLFWRRSIGAEKKIETSLIERFLYPKFGPGQMWEEVAQRVVERGGQIIRNQDVRRIQRQADRVCSVTAIDRVSGQTTEYQGDYFFSTMAVQDFLEAIDPPPPQHVREIGQGLIYRDFITVGMLVSRLNRQSNPDRSEKLLKDNWIYIQEPDVKIGRLQIFNNWSPAMVAHSDQVWLGLEYFCQQSDPLWSLSNEQMIALGADELDRIGLIEKADVLDATVVRQTKAYPAYFGTYDRFDEIRQWLDSLTNLFPIGRNGMHRYNNQDHSMLAAMTAVDNTLSGRVDKSNIWEVNMEQEYHENISIEKTPR